MVTIPRWFVIWIVLILTVTSYSDFRDGLRDIASDVRFNPKR